MTPPLHLDALIFGGGVAGLWTLDEFARAGRSALLIEAAALGQGQTIWSQGILHGGLKYTLAGVMTRSARAIRDLPGRWRACLDADDEPNLAGVRVRAQHCWLWRTESLRSRLGMIGARAGLRIPAAPVADADRPEALRACPGAVARLDEQVISPASLLHELRRRRAGRIIRVDPDAVAFDRTTGAARTVALHAGEPAQPLTLAPGRIILLAGAGNTALRERLGLRPGAAQVRPLHMAMVRAPGLPELNGHCVDGGATRLTITSDADAHGRTVWQLGGRVAERGAAMSPAELTEHARAELLAVLPGLGLHAAEWSTYQAPRAEGRTRTGGRPDGAVVLEEDGVITGWPTKLVLAPHLAADIVARTAAAVRRRPADHRAADELDAAIEHWPAPAVAAPPWDDPAAAWTR